MIIMLERFEYTINGLKRVVEIDDTGIAYETRFKDGRVWCRKVTPEYVKRRLKQIIEEGGD